MLLGMLTLPKAFHVLLPQSRPGIVAEALVHTRTVLRTSGVDGERVVLMMGAQRIQRVKMVATKAARSIADGVRREG